MTKYKGIGIAGWRGWAWAERRGPITGTSAVSLASVEVQADVGVDVCRVSGHGQLPVRRMSPMGS